MTVGGIPTFFMIGGSMELDQNNIISTINKYLIEENLELYDINIVNFPNISKIEVFVYSIEILDYKIIERLSFQIQRLLEEIKAKSYVMVLGLTPVNETKMPFAECLWYSNKACAKYERQIEETCLNLDIPFLPIHEAMRSESCWKDLLEADGIHLSPNGHIWMYEKIKSWKPLKQWLQR